MASERTVTGEDALDEVRRGWVHEQTPERRAILQAHIANWTARERARVCHPHGDAIADRVIDGVWVCLGREPTPEEYTEIARLLEEAVAYCLNEAQRLRAGASEP